MNLPVRSISQFLIESTVLEAGWNETEIEPGEKVWLSALADGASAPRKASQPNTAQNF